MRVAMPMYYTMHKHYDKFEFLLFNLKLCWWVIARYYLPHLQRWRTYNRLARATSKEEGCMQSPTDPISFETQPSHDITYFKPSPTSSELSYGTHIAVPFSFSFCYIFNFLGLCIAASRNHNILCFYFIFFMCYMIMKVLFNKMGGKENIYVLYVHKTKTKKYTELR